MERVFEKLNDKERKELQDDQKGNLSFLEYLQILLGHVEMKFKNVIPKHNWDDLSIEELVYFGTQSTAAIAAAVSS